MLSTKATSLFVVLALTSGAGSLLAQSPCPTQVLQDNPPMSSDLICLVPQVYGPGGLVGASEGGPLDDTQGHEVHFQASSLRSFAPVNSEIGVQLSQLPIAAPVAGFIFAGGVITPTSSFGPVLTDRAETLGRRKIFLSLSYQYFNFDKADGVNLKSFGTVFTHELEPSLCKSDPGLDCVDGEPVYTKDIIATQNRIDLKVHQFTLVGTYGISDKIDLSVALPILNVRMGMQSTAKIYNFEPPPVNHQFILDNSDPFDAQFTNKGYSFGMGDVTVRVKYLAWQGEKAAFSLGTDFRLATGDADNFLGTGTWGLRPFAVYSARLGRLSPHSTVGFQGNGQSVLAGDVTSEPVTKTHLPNQFSYSGGADFSLFRRMGISGDFIGSSLLHGFKIRSSTYTDYVGNTHPDISTSADTINFASVAAGIKFNPFGNLLITANGLFRINDAGLHSKPAPLFGLSYTF
jgi:hypothetical protein